jgi:ribosomal protein S18 acetylase RimI-like enzyme
MTPFLQNLDGLRARRADERDQEFLSELYASTRDDLRQIAADQQFIASLIVMQQRMQETGYRNAFPEAVHYILERAGNKIGRVIINAIAEEIRLIDISLIPQARRQGIGKTVLTSLQASAAAMRLPLCLSAPRSNPRAKKLYLSCGLHTYASDDIAEQMIWRDAESPCASRPI